MRISLSGIGERIRTSSPDEGAGAGDGARAEDEVPDTADSGCIVSRIGLPVIEAGSLDGVDEFLLGKGLVSGPWAILKHAGSTGLRLSGVGEKAADPHAGEEEPAG